MPSAASSRPDPEAPLFRKQAEREAAERAEQPWNLLSHFTSSDQHKGPSLYLCPQSSFYWFPAPFPFSSSKACKWLSSLMSGCLGQITGAAAGASPVKKQPREELKRRGVPPGRCSGTFHSHICDGKQKDYSQFSEWKSGTNCSSLSGT